MVMLKLLVLFALSIAPLGTLVFAMLWFSTVAVVGLVAFWMLIPSWGPWVYVGICLNLLLWRAWNLYVKKLNMATYITSPSIRIQNGTAVKLGIGALIGCIRSFVGDDLTGIVMGGLIAGLLFFLQGVLFPNPAVILQACGDPMETIEKLTGPFEQGTAIQEVMGLLEKVNYPMLLKFNRQMRRKGIFGTMLARELAQMVEDQGRQGGRDST